MKIIRILTKNLKLKRKFSSIHTWLNTFMSNHISTFIKLSFKIEKLPAVKSFDINK